MPRNEYVFLEEEGNLYDVVEYPDINVNTDSNTKSWSFESIKSLSKLVSDRSGEETEGNWNGNRKCDLTGRYRNHSIVAGVFLILVVVIVVGINYGSSSKKGVTTEDTRSVMSMQKLFVFLFNLMINRNLVKDRILCLFF